MCPSKKECLIITVALTLIIIAGIILIIILSKNTKEKNYSEILCLYNIGNDNINEEIPILGNEYENKDESILDIYINGTKIKYTKKYKFTKNGTYEIKYISKIYMNYIFKNIETLYQVEMFSNTSDKIVSIISAFEGCQNLLNVTISGFNTEQVKSTHKLFYNSNIINLNLENFSTNNVEDMSYMFSKII